MTQQAQMSFQKEERYKKTIRELQEQLDEGKNIPYEQAVYTVEKYHKVFGWLNNQEWYQNNHHKVKRYVESLIEPHDLEIID